MLRLSACLHFLCPSQDGEVVQTRVSITNAKSNLQVTLSDISGKQLWQSKAPALKGEGNIIRVSIPIQNFAPGIYMVQVKDEKESLILKMVSEQENFR